MKCRFSGCRNQRHVTAGWCTGHWWHVKRGVPPHPLKTQSRHKRARDRLLRPNPALPGTLLVPLTQGYFAVIDEADQAAVGAFSWHVKHGRHTRYAQTSMPNNLSVFLHTMVWVNSRRPPTPRLDHRNQDGLDCRRSNIRAATRAQNQANRGKQVTNRSGYKGVSWQEDVGRWKASIQVKGKKRCLGWFDDPAEANKAYEAAAIEAHGEFARAA